MFLDETLKHQGAAVRHSLRPAIEVTAHAGNELAVLAAVFRPCIPPVSFRVTVPHTSPERASGQARRSQVARIHASLSRRKKHSTKRPKIGIGEPSRSLAWAPSLIGGSSPIGRSPPIARRSRTGPARGCRSNGQ